MSIGDWIRELHARERERSMQKEREEDIALGRARKSLDEQQRQYLEGWKQGWIQGWEIGLKKGYLLGYADAQAGRPSRYQEQESDCNGVTE